MDSYKIFFKRSAKKELRGISQPYLSQILDRIQHLGEEPRPPQAEMLKGEGRYFRVRQGDYRIVYEVDDANSVVTILKVGHRREVYS